MRVLFFASDISPQSGASHALMLTAQRLQRRKRHRANFALCKLAVMLEQIVVKAGR